MAHKISDHDKKEFRNYIKGVKPLSKTQPVKNPSNKRPRSNQIHIHHHENLDETGLSTSPVSAEDILSFFRPGLQTKVIRRLKQGHFPLEAELDLHGLNSEQAHHVLLSFLTFCQTQHYRCVRIIHGKSHHADYQPILKNKVNLWLREVKSVLGFHSAKPRHGGAGALYVLLKKEK
jgi:DNA-nicking Smr family endonuclease